VSIIEVIEAGAASLPVSEECFPVDVESALLEFVYLFLDLFASSGSHSLKNVENPPFEFWGVAGEVRRLVAIFVIRGGKFDSLDRLYVRLSGKLRQGSIDEIMIGAGEEMESARLGYSKDLGRGLESIRKCRMEVEIEFHRKESEKIGESWPSLCTHYARNEISGQKYSR